MTQFSLLLRDAGGSSNPASNVYTIEASSCSNDDHNRKDEGKFSFINW